MVNHKGLPMDSFDLARAGPAAQFLVRDPQELFAAATMLLSEIDVRLAVRAAETRRCLGGRADRSAACPRRHPARAAGRAHDRRRARRTPLERFWRKELGRDGAYLASRVSFVWFDGQSLHQMTASVAALPRDSVVFYGLTVVDAAGVPHERFDALAELRRSAQVPIFSVFENELGHGVVGGPNISQMRVGLETARIALRQLSASPAAAPELVTVGMDTVAYGARELRRWRIDESRRPPGSEVRFREPSPRVRYCKKIDAVCFGWLAPFFFIGTGAAFDVAALGRDVQTMLLVPTFLALFLLARGLPTWLYRRDLPRGELAPLALSSAVASLGIVVVVNSVGLKSGHLDADVAEALIGAALLSLLVYPTAARVLLARAQVGVAPARASSARA